MIRGPVILGNEPALLKRIRERFCMARDLGEFDAVRTEPNGAEWCIWATDVDQDDIWGFALLSYAGPGLVALEPIWVAPAHRRKGIARSIVKTAISMQAGLGKQVLIGVTNDNRPMLDLTRALGFQASGVILTRNIGD